MKFFTYFLIILASVLQLMLANPQREETFTNNSISLHLSQDDFEYFAAEEDDKDYLTDTSYSIDETEKGIEEEAEVIGDEETNDRARWSYAPGFVERWCLKACRENGKPFGRLIGTRCQCYCPLNASELGLCKTIGACDRYCASIGYLKGGDCVFNNVCFCFCKKHEPYDVNQVHTTPPP